MTPGDVAVLGAGPAGLAAAVAAAEAGLEVTLVDAAARPGGQYFRHPPGSHHATGSAEFIRLHAAVTGHDRIRYLAGHRVWAVEHGAPFVVHALAGQRAGRPVEIRARTLVIATGAHDRVLPFPGWELPGVLTAGGAQALLKGDLVAVGRRVVVAGSGPFLLPVAAGLAAAGVRVAGTFEANRPHRFARHGVRVVRNAGRLAEGMGYAATLIRHRVPYHVGRAVVAAHGGDQVEAVTVARLDRDWTPVPGTEREIECDSLAVGYGFTPQLEIPVELGCATRTDDDGSLVVVVDGAQRTSVPEVYAAGETTGVGGARLALVEGELAGLAAAGAGGRRAWRLRSRRARLRAFAAALHDVYAVRPGWTGWPRADTLVCRCEEVPYGRLAEAVRDLGVTDLRTAKLITRTGMGWCQGRICGYPTACLTARILGDEAGPDLTGSARRPLAQPIRLGDLAAGTTGGPAAGSLAGPAGGPAGGPVAGPVEDT